MDTLLKTFPLSFLLRSLFAGVFFVFSYFEATGPRSPVTITNDNVYTVALPFALIAGVIIYGIHRSLFFPFVEWGLESGWSKRRRAGKLPLISKNARESLAERLRDQSTKDEHYPYQLAQYINAWGDYIHLQFTAAWCIVFGAVSGIIVSDRISMHQVNHSPDWWLVFVSAIFFIAAIVSNWRLHAVLECLHHHK